MCACSYTDPLCVQQHMLKLFENCKELRFVRGNSAVSGMVAPQEESFDFRTAVNAEVIDFLQRLF